jgi:vacuolar-type H+-ATPase subunit E/Vma4
LDNKKTKLLEKVNKSLDHVENSKQASKFILNFLSAALRENIEPGKIVSFISSKYKFVDDSKLSILKNLVRFLSFIKDVIAA